VALDEWMKNELPTRREFLSQAEAPLQGGSPGPPTSRQCARLFQSVSGLESIGKHLLSVLFLVLLTTTAGSAAPISSCVANLSGIGITCNVYESNAGGNPSEISSIFSLGTSAVAGYVVLLESPTADETNIANWSDVLHFIDDGVGLASTAQLLSAGCGCFPSFATVSAAAGQFIVETQFGTGDDFKDFTTYQPTVTDTYNIYSAAPLTAVPEPGSFFLAGATVLSLALRRKL
jgi:PEP-CTERM motif